MYSWLMRIVLAIFAMWALTTFPVSAQEQYRWSAVGISGGGGMFSPAISPVNPNLMMINCDMSAAYISQDGGKNWQMIHSLQLRSNTQCKPAFHPTEENTIYAANGWSGISVSKDAGKSWQKLEGLKDGLVGEITINPLKPNQILVGNGEWLYRSEDAGENWEKCSDVQGESIAQHFDQSEPGTCFAATKSGLWKSKDSGKSWQSIPLPIAGEQIYDFAAGSNEKTGCILYVTLPGKAVDGKYVGGIFKSEDKGATWESVNNPKLNLELEAFDEWAMGDISQYLQIATSNADPSLVFAFNTSTGVPPPHQATTFRSRDAGKSWEPTFFADPRWQPFNVEKDYTVVGINQYYQDVPRVAVCQTDPNKILLVDNERAYTTLNAGDTWQIAHSTPNPKETDPPTWLCNGLVVTTTWNYYIDPFKKNNHYICYTDIGFGRSEDKGASWAWWNQHTWAPWRNTCYELAFDPEVPGKVWGAFSDVHDIPNGNIIWGKHGSVGQGGVCLSIDHAKSWKYEANGLPKVATTSVVLDPNSPKENRTLYAGQFGAGVYKSTDGGINWKAINQGLGNGDNMRVTKVYLHPDGTLFAMITALRVDGQFTENGPGLYKSTDEGEHWELVNASQKLRWPKDFTVDPENSKIIYIGAANAQANQSGIWRTTDGGEKWERILNKGPEHFGAYFDPYNKGWIYATLTEGAPEEGLWLSKDNGANWAPISGLPFSNVHRITFDPDSSDIIYATTFGGSVWKGEK